MHQSGILILTHHVSLLCHGDAVKNIIAGIKKLVSSTLYVHVANTSPQQNSSSFQTNDLESLFKSNFNNGSSSYPITKRHFSSDVFPFLTKFYSEASHQCRELDVNILLHNIGLHQNVPACLQRNVNCIISDCNSNILQDEKFKFTIKTFVNSICSKPNNTSDVPLISISDTIDEAMRPISSDKTISSKGAIVIGGTYDHIHSGHKVLLSEATLLADKKLVIGLTDGVMLERKLLSDMIESWDVRKQQLTDFLCEISHFNSALSKKNPDDPCCSNPRLEIAQITDPVGPAGTDAELDCIVLSKETVKGGDFVNETRRKNGLNALDVHLIGGGNLIDDEQGAESPVHESKFSSSTMRYELLGNLLKKPNRLDDDAMKAAYVIGLTGGMASGKSSIAKRLNRLGAVVIDCDKLGHAAYDPGTATFERVVKRFGSDVVSLSGDIDRKRLAEKVFSIDSSGGRSHLDDLNAIVWPEIERLARKRIAAAISEHSVNDAKRVVCVLDAAVLLEAGWNRFVDEVWVCVVPTSEATKRIQERDGRTKEEAEKRINAQMSGRDRVRQAHVVLSTLWEPSVTQTQVEKAWKLLQERIRFDWKCSNRL